MKALLKTCALLLALGMGSSFAANQTAQLSPIFPNSQLPFRITIEKAFQLPIGFHSGVVGEYKGQWVFVAGRINGMHGFGPDPFPPDLQNRRIFVINSQTGTAISRSLDDPTSGLSQQQIESLSVTSPQGYQEATTLYMTGGYGFDAATGSYSTKPFLTAIYLPGIIQWVTNPADKTNSAIKNIRQISNPVFQITGGRMFKLGSVTQLVFGQNFTGVYTSQGNGEYSQQVREFVIRNDTDKLSVDILHAKPFVQDPNYRRRDMNILPTLLNKANLLTYGLVAYSGVFTESGGVWTVPVVIDEGGNPTMANPNLPTTFKQGMNQYASAAVGLYSRKSMNMYHIILGGLSYGYYQNGVFQTDSEIPFINQITTIKMDKNGVFTQYIMDAEYPVIISDGPNPGNPLLFGAGAFFVPNNILQYPNRVISLDTIRKPTVLGYVVGGIASTLPNTNDKADSFASPFVFRVTLVPAV